MLYSLKMMVRKRLFHLVLLVCLITRSIRTRHARLAILSATGIWESRGINLILLGRCLVGSSGISRRYARASMPSNESLVFRKTCLFCSDRRARPEKRCPFGQKNGINLYRIVDCLAGWRSVPNTRAFARARQTARRRFAFSSRDARPRSAQERCTVLRRSMLLRMRAFGSRVKPFGRQRRSTCAPTSQRLQRPDFARRS